METLTADSGLQTRCGLWANGKQQLKLLPLLWFLTPVPVTAQDSAAVRLDTVVVSASKGPAGTGSATQAATVITGAELRAAGLQRVSDALRLTGGAAIVGTGAIGSVTSLFLRGGESRYAKVLIDGVPVNAVGGYFDFSHLTTDNVERIEVVRGPGSVVYGADAMTGVVHIFTRRGSPGASAELEMRGGTFDTRDGSASLSGGLERLQYSFGAARHSTDGILPFNNEYRNRTLSGSLRFVRISGTTLQISGRHGTARYHYPTDFVGFVDDSNSFRDQRRATMGADFSHDVGRLLSIRVLAGANDVTDVTDDVEPPPPWEDGTEDIHYRFRTRTGRRSGELRGTLRLPRLAALLTSGVEYVRETERSLAAEAPVGTMPAPTSTFAGTRETRTAFAELSGARGVVEYVVSGRADRPTDFATFRTYRAGVSARFGAVRLRTSAGTAFNAPAFSQLLPTEFTVGSPQLDPERSRSLEAGIELTLAGERLRLAATRFDQRFRDLIQFVSGGPPDFLGSYANLTSATSRGTELELRALPVAGWLLTASYTQLDARVDRIDDRFEGSLEPGQRLIRRPPQSGAAALSYVGSGRGTLSLSARYVGRRPDLDFREFPSPVVELAPYTIADVAGSVRVLRSAGGSALSLTARIENLFDRPYEEVLYYAAPGRTILLGGRAELPLR